MAKKEVTEGSMGRAGPQAMASKKPLMLVIEEETIKQAKIRAIQDGTNVSRVAGELLKGWVAGLYKLKQ
ncbi:hypothetical protein GPL17_32660 [Bradyrhizobium yuanmingense]|uniref:hypothetical protein n=1 Tax=Bradyrhizobium yuanmingense TaxID=108015 RepID=UPI0012F88156|nr:hypothetical protein [Bradyrhizobium yuanmingense]MVT55192.1 hypothetical protein [Bradyrhizobium yuanmingense]